MKKIFTALMASAMLSASALAADIPKEGTKAPGFTLPGQDGKDVSLSDFKGKWVVLYFYPKDFTSGCSIEAHNFQADKDKYLARKTAVIGISVDSVDSHKEFCTKEGLEFKLLSDGDHKVSDLYGSVTNLVVAHISTRHTFLIDTKGIIRKEYLDVKPMQHSAEVLADLETLQK